MRISILLTLFIGMIFSTKTAAQSVEETLDWLNTKYPTYILVEKYAEQEIFLEEMIVAPSFIDHRDRLDTVHQIPYRKIREITYQYQPFIRYGDQIQNEAHIIVFSGEFEEKHPIHPEKNKEIRNVNLYIKPTVGKVDVERMIKALKHLATLKGAQLLKEDMF